MKAGKILMIGVSLCAISGCFIIFPTYKNIAPNKLQYKDSLYLVYTANEWAKVRFDIYNDDSQNSNYATKHPNYSVLRVFYSPDSLKMIAWLGLRMENGHGCNGPANKDSFSGSAVIGIRDNVKQGWKIYPFDEFSAACFNNFDQVVSQMGRYYFFQMKKSLHLVNKIYLDPNYGGEVRYDIEKQKIAEGSIRNELSPIFKEFGYNLRDKDFWTKSLVWQNGARIPGLYNFQTKGNVAPDRKDPERMMPKIIYPDSILRLYR